MFKVSLVLQKLNRENYVFWGSRPQYFNTALSLLSSSSADCVLKHLGLWNLKAGLLLKAKAPSLTISIDYSDPKFHFLPLPSIRTRNIRTILVRADYSIDFLIQDFNR